MKLPPNPFQPEQTSQNPLDNARHLRVYVENGKLRVQAIEQPFSSPTSTTINISRYGTANTRCVMHIDIDTDEKQRQMIALRLVKLYFKYMSNPPEDS